MPRSLPSLLAHDGYVGAHDEAFVEGLRLCVLSAPRLARYAPGSDEVLITIRSAGRAPAARAAGWVDVLALQFDDTGQYASVSAATQPMTETDARAVLAFVGRHRRWRCLVIQCDAGVSRSRSLAAAIAEHCQLPYRWTIVNPDVVDLIRRVASAEGCGPG